MLNVTRALFEGIHVQAWREPWCKQNKEVDPALRGTVIAFISWLLLSPSVAFAADQGTLITMLINIGKHILPFIKLMQGLSAVIGAYFVFDGLVELWAVNDDRALKYLKGRDRFSNGSALVSIILGAVFIALSDLSLVGALSRTLAGQDDIENIKVGQRWAWTYTNVNDQSDISQQTEAAAHALLGIMQILGMVAMIRGWLTINAYYNQRQNAGLGIAFGWLIGGVIAWNLNWFGKTLNKTLGVDILWFFKFT